MRGGDIIAELLLLRLLFTKDEFDGRGEKEETLLFGCSTGCAELVIISSLSAT